MFILMSVIACRGNVEATPPLLRPLLHTQAPRGTDRTVLGFEEWQDPNTDPTAWPTEFQTSVVLHGEAAVPGPSMTPEALVLDVYAALTLGDEARLRSHLFDPTSLAVASRMNADTAQRTADEIADSTQDAFEVFTFGSPSDARAGGLGALLQTGQLVIGRGRNVDGSASSEDEIPIMHWGSELTFSIRNTDIEFVLRFPNLLQDESGVWRLRAAPRVDTRFRTYRNLGLDLKPELMDVEHASIPLGVGNYWHYRTRLPGVSSEDGDSYGLLTRDGYRDAVTEVMDHGGYRVIRLRRMFDDPARQAERFSYLLTPRRLYICERECVRRASSFEWVLTYAAQRTPVLVLPLQFGGGWGVGGEPDRDNNYRVDPEPQIVGVPAGNFDDAYEIARSTTRGRQTAFFVPGIGFVMRRTASTVETQLEELIAFRILP
jgi:hypothetical protein